MSHSSVYKTCCKAVIRGCPPNVASLEGNNLIILIKTHNFLLPICLSFVQSFQPFHSQNKIKTTQVKHIRIYLEFHLANLNCQIFTFSLQEPFTAIYLKSSRCRLELSNSLAFLTRCPKEAPLSLRRRLENPPRYCFLSQQTISLLGKCCEEGTVVFKFLLGFFRFRSIRKERFIIVMEFAKIGAHRAIKPLWSKRVMNSWHNAQRC